jgi:hypothetical protein
MQQSWNKIYKKYSADTVYICIFAKRWLEQYLNYHIHPIQTYKQSTLFCSFETTQNMNKPFKKIYPLTCMFLGIFKNQ